MIILNHPEAVASTATIRVILETLGVRSLRESDPEEFNQHSVKGIESSSFGEGTGDTIIAPFSCLESISSVDLKSGSREFKFPPSIKRVLLHTFTESSQHLLNEVLNEPSFRFVRIGSKHADLICSSKEVEICGPLAGLRIRSNEEISYWGLVSSSLQQHKISPIIQSDGASLLLRIRRQGLEIFLLLASDLTDINRTVTKPLDIRSCLLGLGAPVMVLRYFLLKQGWPTRKNFANLIIDDPTLTLNYGYIDFKHLKEQAVERNLSITVAFIPWNYRRGRKSAIRFFKAASDHISICVHGCNHTRSEFGGTDAGHLDTLASLAGERMESLNKRTGLSFSKIMVFPQGIFSSYAMDVLKRNNFLAAVNTELKDVSGEKDVKVKDLLKLAVTSYHGFPLFLRRNICDGVANFAFDMLLGKPCLIVSHQKDFFSNTGPVWQLVDAINKLQVRVEWSCLEDIITRSTTCRLTPDNKVEVEVFSRFVDLGALPEIPGSDRILVKKVETDMESVESVIVGKRSARWSCDDGQIVIDVGDRHEAKQIEFSYKRMEPAVITHFGLKEVVSIFFRRVFSEFRDKYLSRSPALMKVLNYVRR